MTAPERPLSRGVVTRYAQIGDDRKAHWMWDDESVNDCSGALFASGAEYRAATEVFGENAPNLRIATAPRLLKAPSLEVISDETNAAVRKVTLRVISRRQAPRLMVSVVDGKVLRSDVQGQPFTTDAQDIWVLNTVAPPVEGLTISFELDAAMPLRIRLMDSSFGLPTDQVPPRPAGLIAQPSPISDVMLAVTEVDI